MTVMTEQGAPPTAHRDHLAALIRRRRRELGLSLLQFQERAVDPETGVQVKYGWVNRLETGEQVIPPRLPQLRALAAAADVPLGVVQDAAGAEFFGIDSVWSESGEARAFIERAERLNADQREQILRLIDTIVPPPEN
ncbi:helix-turn-helix domain-containing protein [Streptomyces decoyicus]|uniref:XRE family transcriptional regulator n=1 Tax=Streptomyces decoyicus TaxID=249567 RepID=UPI002E183C8A